MPLGGGAPGLLDFDQKKFWNAAEKLGINKVKDNNLLTVPFRLILYLVCFGSVTGYV